MLTTAIWLLAAVFPTDGKSRLTRRIQSAVIGMAAVLLTIAVNA